MIDGRGRTVVPGFIDTHVHALDVAARGGDATVPESPHRSRRCRTGSATKRRGGRRATWIWTPRTFPDAAARAPLPDARRSSTLPRPIIPSSSTAAYAFSLNTRGAPGRRHHARLAESSRRRDRQGCRGRADRPAAERGRPAHAVPSAPRPSSRSTTLERVHRQYLAAGITSVIERGATLAGFEMYRALERRGASARARDGDHPRARRDRSGRVERFVQGLPFAFGEGDEWLKAGPLKIVADGGILIGTSFMRKPFGRGRAALYALDNPGGSRLPDAHARADRGAPSTSSTAAAGRWSRT